MTDKINKYAEYMTKQIKEGSFGYPSKSGKQGVGVDARGPIEDAAVSLDEAKGRVLKASYSMELAHNLKAVHGLDVETELANILSAEMLAETNREVIRTIYTPESEEVKFSDYVAWLAEGDEYVVSHASGNISHTTTNPKEKLKPGQTIKKRKGELQTGTGSSLFNKKVK